jgi:hypothetical protein
VNPTFAAPAAAAPTTALATPQLLVFGDPIGPPSVNDFTPSSTPAPVVTSPQVITGKVVSTPTAGGPGVLTAVEGVPWWVWAIGGGGVLYFATRRSGRR